MTQLNVPGPAAEVVIIQFCNRHVNEVTTLEQSIYVS